MSTREQAARVTCQCQHCAARAAAASASIADFSAVESPVSPAMSSASTSLPSSSEIVIDASRIHARRHHRQFSPSDAHACFARADASSQDRLVDQSSPLATTQSSAFSGPRALRSVTPGSRSGPRRTPAAWLEIWRRAQAHRRRRGPDRRVEVPLARGKSTVYRAGGGRATVATSALFDDARGDFLKSQGCGPMLCQPRGCKHGEPLKYSRRAHRAT